MSGFNPTAQPVESWNNHSFNIPQHGGTREDLSETPEASERSFALPATLVSRVLPFAFIRIRAKFRRHG
jgi:hypothetical protein